MVFSNGHEEFDHYVSTVDAGVGIASGAGGEGTMMVVGEKLVFEDLGQEEDLEDCVRFDELVRLVGNHNRRRSTDVASTSPGGGGGGDGGDGGVAWGWELKFTDCKECWSLLKEEIDLGERERDIHFDTRRYFVEGGKEAKDAEVVYRRVVRAWAKVDEALDNATLRTDDRYWPFW